MAIRTLCYPDNHTFLCKFSNGCMLLTVGSIYTKLGDFVKLGLHFMTTVFPRIIAGGVYFYFRTKRGRLFEGGDYFKYFSQEVVPYIFCFIIPNNKGKSEIREHYHRKNCKKRYFCNHPVVKTNLHKRDHEI